MQAVSGLDLIFWDHFTPFRARFNKNRFERLHAIWVAGLPLVLGVTIATFFAPFVAASAATGIAVYAVVASVMTAIMPTISGLLGSVDVQAVDRLKSGSVTDSDHIRAAEVLMARVEVVRGLYAAIAWSVLMLCLAMVPLLIVCHPIFQPPAPVAAQASDPSKAAPAPTAPTPLGAQAVRWICVAVIGFAGCTSFVALLQIVSGVHLMNRDNQVALERDVQMIADRFHLR